MLNTIIIKVQSTSVQPFLCSTQQFGGLDPKERGLTVIGINVERWKPRCYISPISGLLDYLDILI